MKIFSKLRTSIKKLQLKATNLQVNCSVLLRPENLKRLKVVKCYRDCKAWNRRLDHRMQLHTTAPDIIDETERKCSNCGHHYSGRICPQCGQAGTWSRYTWKQAILNLMDIWGLGNRPMFRTLRELYTRPGYMIRDYLNGHRQFYFPPFKLVAVAVVLLIFVGWLTGVHGLSPLSFFAESIGLDEVHDWDGIKPFVETKLETYTNALNISGIEISSALKSVIAAIMWFVLFLSKNMLYEWLFIGAVLGICIWIAFIKVNKYNSVETYIFLTYVLAQFLLCLIPGTLLIWLEGSLASVSPFLQQCAGYAFVAYSCAVIFLLIVVFRQFFGLTWMSTVLHLLLTLLVATTLLYLIGLLITAISQKLYDVVGNIIVFTIAIALIVKGFSYAKQFLKANKEAVPRAVNYGCKAAMLVILYTLKCMSIDIEPVFLSYILILIAMVVFAPLSVSLSLLPVAVYKKYHSTSRALLSLLPIAILFIVMASI